MGLLWFLCFRYPSCDLVSVISCDNLVGGQEILRNHVCLFYLHKSKLIKNVTRNIFKKIYGTD